MWLSPVIPRTAEALLKANRVYDEAITSLKLPVMFGTRPFAFPATQYEHIFLLLIGFAISDDPEVNKRSVDGFRQLLRISAENGWGEYRVPAIFQDEATGYYSYNNNVLRRFQEALKDAVDPKGIMSAGRYGIWPKHLRSKS